MQKKWILENAHFLKNLKVSKLSEISIPAVLEIQKNKQHIQF